MPNQKGKKQDFGGKKGDFGNSADPKFVKNERHPESDTKMHQRNEGGKNHSQGGDDGNNDGGKERTAKVWEHINKSVSKDKREDIKEDLPEVVEPQIVEQPSMAQQSPVQPVNPFDSSSGREDVFPMEPSDEGDFVYEETEEVVEPLVEPMVEPMGEPVGEPVQPVPKSVPEPKPQPRPQSAPEPKVEVVEVKRSDIKNREVSKDVPKERITVDNPVSQVDIGATVQQRAPQVQEFKEDLWDILEQAGITKGRIVWGLGVIILVVLGLYFFVFNDGTVSVPEVVVDVPVESVDLPNPSASENIITSYLLGLEFSKIDGGAIYERTVLDDALKIGTSETDTERFVRYVAVLRAMQNIYDTDVYALLDRTLDRRGEMEAHLRKMNDLLVEAEIIFNEVNLILDSLDEAYGVVGLNRDSAENQFFNSSEGLYGEEAYRELGDFVDYSQEAVEIKAYFNAYKILRDMYLNSINVLNPRYEDIALNKEAIIKGIRVFDVQGSDIDAIIRLSE